MTPQRLHYAGSALRRWQLVGDNGLHLGKMTRVALTNMISVILAADDEFQAHIKDQRVLDLEAELAAARADIGKQRYRVTQDRRRAEDVNRRARDADAKLREAQRLTSDAVGWKNACEGYVRQANILRGQLNAAGIEIDPRCR